jgi:hypothetical protein
MYAREVHADDFVGEIGVQTSRDPEKAALLRLRFAKLFCEFRLLQTERVSYLLCIAIQRRSVETVWIEEKRNRLHAASELSLLPVQEFAALRTRFDCVLLLLARAVSETFVL